MSDIQHISITSTQTVAQPKPHTTYTIQISTPTRTWTVSRRYNDFISLDAELVSSAGKQTPASLPPKHPWSITRSAYDEKIVRERKVLLETYLRSILTHRDGRWRSSYTFNDFLSVPNPSSRSNNASSSTSTPSSLGVTGPPDHFTPSNWLAEHSHVQSLLRSTRAALLKRDALAGMGDASGSRGSSVEAKKLLREVGDRVLGLERGLGGIAGGLGEGEKRRREEMVEGVKAEWGNLQRMAEAGIRSTASATASALNRDSSSGSSSFMASAQGSMPGGTGSLNGNHSSMGRVFGSRPPPQETIDTRPLDDAGLVQLQQNQMNNQDEQLQELSRLLLRQRAMGEEIHKEIGEQSDMLDEVDSEVGKLGNKLSKTKRQMNRLT